ncbi:MULTISPECIES: phosphatidylserine/phosphatidylglycerophosphate/cardiolipin synthase family protein [unclassified Pantoea]|uniref:phospholipase D-like domain-containing protein n=1 Tax=unclassified Pantoea TaxID=2630326 RepID=UPI00272BC08E|nr:MULTISPECIES: phospholipase D family protein [unclassified Pantoea]
MSEAASLPPEGAGLKALAEARCAMHPGLSGIYPLNDGLDAFAARYLLMGMAQHSIDVQYYIWHNDLSGRLLFSALLDAAERGVKVRLLLDDNNTPGLDDTLAELDRHPNIAVRLFNPFSFRTLRALGYLTDFARLNRRMHNKSLTVDGAVTLVGGRNVGDEYFGTGDEPLFTDLDVLAMGPVVQEVEADFARYWQSKAVSPLRSVVDVTETAQEAVRLPSEWQQSEAVQRYLARLEHAEFVNQMAQGTLEVTWAAARLLSDDPRKGLGKARRGSLLPQRMLEVIGAPQQQFDIISAYFVPTRAGVAQLLTLKRRGVKIAILTNSLAANDVSVVHAGYARWRKKLLRHGIALYELKPQQQSGEAPHDRGLTGNSGSSLHAKTFTVDNRKVFIGSFNFDPRSAVLNTEMGLVIESESLAQQTHQHFIAGMRDRAWTLRLDKWGRVNWVEYPGEAHETVHKHEPQCTWLQRLLVRLVWRLPVEWLL